MLPLRAKLPVVCCLLLGCLGCGGRSGPSDSPSPTAERLEKIGDAYVRATTLHNRPPRNLEELLPALKYYGKTEELLVSPNDGAPFHIVWGVELRRLKAKGKAIPIIAYEKTGKDGKRHVLRGRNEVLLLSAGELKSATFPPDYTFPF
jgi:hypothetical protein